MIDTIIGGLVGAGVYVVFLVIARIALWWRHR